MRTTGRFRNDLIAAAGTTRDTGAVTPAPTTAGTPYANWLDRMQRTRSRHAAITRNLYTWSSYKNWAERVRDSWDEGVGDGEAAGEPARETRRPR